MDDSNKSWRKWGDQDPYFGVLTDPKFKRDKLTGSALSEFFQSGEDHVKRVLTRQDEVLRAGNRGSALDFGYGVGRILIPMAKRFDTAAGVNVSEGMLAEARRTAESQGVDKVQLVKSDDGLTQVRGSFDLVHTFIVMQHIPPS